MNEPSRVWQAWTTEANIRGKNEGKDNLKTLLHEVDEDDDGDVGIELVSNGQDDVEKEDDTGEEKTNKMSGENPTS